MVSPEAGWYADPTDPSAVRWWDGAAWSAQTRAAPRELALAGAAVGASSASGGAGAAPSTPTATADLPGVVTIGAEPTPAPAPAPSAPTAPVAAAAAAAHETALPATQTVADRSRPGARRAPAPAPATPVEVAMPPASAAPIRPNVTPGSTPSQPSAAWIDASYPSAQASGGSGFGSAPQRFGGSAPITAQTKMPRPPMHWKVPVAIGVVLALILGAAAAVGIPRYLASKAQAQADLAPDVLTRSAPKALAGQRTVALPGMNAASIGTQLTGDGAAWAWAQAYGTRDAFTLYVASDVPVADRADAVRALTSHGAAATLISEVSAGLTAGSSGRAVAGTPVDYASPVGGKTWCMPLTVSGVAGGYCLWTSGKEFLQVLTMPGIEQVSAKSTMTALKQMAAAVTLAGPASTLVPKPAGK